MAVTTIQPEVWASALLESLKKRLVFAAESVCNRDYVGDIESFGDTVHIASVTDPTVTAYTVDTDITIQALTDSELLLQINQQNYFGFQVDDVVARQSKATASLFEQATMQASYKLRDAADSVVATALKTDTLAGNKLGATTVNSADTAFNTLVSLNQKLDESNVPSDGRYVIISPAYYGYMLKDSRFINAQAYGSTDPIQNGRVGRVIGLDVYVSNNLAAGAASGKIVQAGHPMATTYADQIASVETGRMEKRFASFVKGLHLFGTKVIRPAALANADVTVS